MKSVLVLIVGFLLWGCDSDEIVSGNGPALNGWVILHDSLGNRVLDNSGVTVTIQGSGLSAASDADGQWNFYHFPSDSILTLIFTKPGYAQKRDIDYSVSIGAGGNAFYGSMKLFAIPTFHPQLALRPFENLGSDVTPKYKTRFSLRIDEYDLRPSVTAKCILYFSRTSTISAAEPASYQFATRLIETSPADGVASFDVYADSLYANGFRPGDRVYCVGYAAGKHSIESYYTDIASGKNIYTGFSPVNSGVKNFIVP